MQSPACACPGGRKVCFTLSIQMEEKEGHFTPPHFACSPPTDGGLRHGWIKGTWGLLPIRRNRGLVCSPGLLRGSFELLTVVQEVKRRPSVNTSLTDRSDYGLQVGSWQLNG